MSVACAAVAATGVGPVVTTGFVSTRAGSAFWISIVPLKYAPSSMATLAVEMSPVKEALLRRSTRSLAMTLPSTRPCTMTLRASRLARTRPLGPTVRLCPRSEIEPSTSPSTYKSSLPDNSPRTITDFPMVATSTDRGVSARGGSMGRTKGGAGVCIGLCALCSGIDTSSSLRVDFHTGYGSVTQPSGQAAVTWTLNSVPDRSHEHTEVLAHGQIISVVLHT